MDSRLAYLLFFVSFVFFFSSPTPADARASPLLRSVCKNTKNYTKCVKTLRSDARIQSFASIDLKELAISILEIAAETATDSQELFNSYAQMVESSNGAKAVQQCAQSYESVALAFQSTLEGLKANDNMVSHTVASIVNHVKVCEKALSSDGVELPDTIAARVHLVMLYKDIGFTVTSQLANKHLP